MFLFLFVYLGIVAAAAFLTHIAFGSAGGTKPPASCAIDMFRQYTQGYSAREKQLTAGAATAATNIHTEEERDGAIFAKDSALLTNTKVTTQQRKLLGFLETHCNVLPVQAATVRVLNHPTAFYEELKAQVRAAKKSIVMSALYIGEGPLSTKFVECLEEKVREVMARRCSDPSAEPFTITILLDYNRMLDKRNLVTVKQLLALAHEAGGSSLHLDESTEKPPLDVRIYLYQSPCRWNTLFSPFGRAKEALGVQHTKIFVFDGVHTVLTGANLSDDYFATRMDRYVVIECNEYVASWFAQLVDVINKISHQVVCRRGFDELYDESDLTVMPSSPMEKIMHIATSPSGKGKGRDFSNSSPPRPNDNNDNNSKKKKNGRDLGVATLHRKSGLVILGNELGVDPSGDARAFERQVGDLIQDFAAQVTRQFSGVAYKLLIERSDSGYDSVLFPTVQFGRAGIFHDSSIVEETLSQLTSNDHVYLTSPYLNMYSAFVDVILKGSCFLDCVTASVSTNGWRGQKGLAGWIPFFYLQLERAFYFLMQSYNCLARVKVREFSVEGLTFHAKGLWFVGRAESRGKKVGGSTAAVSFTSTEKACQTPPPQASVNSGSLSPATPLSAAEKESIQPPYLVAYGSTNYGYRSVHKDVEAEGFLFTVNPKLRETLRQELLFLLDQSMTVSEEKFVGNEMGRYQPVVSLVAQLAQDFL